MKYVYLENNIVIQRVQVDPYSILLESYAAQFIEAPDYVDTGWKLENDTWVAPPGPSPEYIRRRNKSKVSDLLQETDWVELPSVSDPASTPHLTNVTEFLAYRSALRAIAVNPPTEPAVFPSKPDEVWE
jgi:hypothetical protein